MIKRYFDQWLFKDKENKAYLKEDEKKVIALSFYAVLPNTAILLSVWNLF